MRVTAGMMQKADDVSVVYWPDTPTYLESEEFAAFCRTVLAAIPRSDVVGPPHPGVTTLTIKQRIGDDHRWLADALDTLEAEGRIRKHDRSVPVTRYVRTTRPVVTEIVRRRWCDTTYIVPPADKTKPMRESVVRMARI